MGKQCGAKTIYQCIVSNNQESESMQYGEPAVDNHWPGGATFLLLLISATFDRCYQLQNFHRMTHWNAMIEPLFKPEMPQSMFLTATL